MFISTVQNLNYANLRKNSIQKQTLADLEYLDSSLKKSKEMQQYADIYLLLNYSTCFGRPSRPSSGVHKTVIAASGMYRSSSNVTFGHV